jgi:GT2 family glycosyltransferase
MEAVAVSGKKNDVLEALLCGWWVAPAALLFRRRIVETVKGWDESLTAAQDTDFFLSVALAGARIQYQPGCESIYRRYGNVTVSTSKPRRWLDNHRLVLDKALDVLNRTNRLTPNYRHALALSYFRLARVYFEHDRGSYDQIMARVLQLEPQFKPQEPPLYNAVQRLIGFKGAERLAYAKRRLRLGT